MKLHGKVAIVTGASRGVGRAVALKLAAEGAAVTLAAKTVEPDPRIPGTIYTVQEEILAAGGRAIAIQTDVRDENAIENMVKETVANFGKLDILINNAGAMWWRPVIDTPAKRFDLIMGVNVRAAFLASQAAIPHMRANRWGHIINMSPPIDFRLLPGKVGYFISKYGMTMLSMGLAEELKPYGIAVNSLWPATIVESLASINNSLGDPSVWRKPDILADAVLEIVTTPPATRTGKALIDEEVLGEAGVTDFSHYNCTPDGKPMRIIFD